MLSVTADYGTLAYQIVGSLAGPLQPNASYQIQVDTSVADQRGGSLLLPVHSDFTTADANSAQPVLVSVTPSTVSLAGGTVSVASGSALAGLARVLVGGADAGFAIQSDTTVTITVPPASQAGPADLVVQDQGGPTATLSYAFLYVDDLDPARTHFTPTHGPVGGGTGITLSTDNLAIAPGTTVTIGGLPAVSPDITALNTLYFMTPAAATAGLVPVQITRPGETPLTIGTFSYDLAQGPPTTLPGFPPGIPS